MALKRHRHRAHWTRTVFRDDDVGFAGQNAGHAVDHGLHAGTAQHIDRVGRHFHRDAGFNGHLAADTLAQAAEAVSVEAEAETEAQREARDGLA